VDRLRKTDGLVPAYNPELEASARAQSAYEATWSGEVCDAMELMELAAGHLEVGAVGT
jgi:hypothetical protein